MSLVSAKLQKWFGFVKGVKTAIYVFATDVPDSMLGNGGMFSLYNPNNSYSGGSIVIVTDEVAEQIFQQVAVRPQTGIYGYSRFDTRKIAPWAYPNLPEQNRWEFLCFLPVKIKNCSSGKNVYVNSTQPA